MKYDAKETEKIIVKYLPDCMGYPVKVIEAMNYAFMAGGKRLRPALMNICYDLFVDGEQADSKMAEVLEHFMAAIEMIHTYSLIHDDLPALDNDKLRRGKPTVHVQFGEDIAILAGDGLLNYAYETAAKSFAIMPCNSRVEKAYILLTTKPGIYGMIGGQTLDVIMSARPLDDKQLEYIYLNKTAALLECCMMIGAILGGASDEDVDRICQIARSVGMAFQVQDDILDLVGDEEIIGKPVRSDEKNEKTTYVTMYGMNKAKQYVKDMSDNSIELLDSLDVKNNEAKEILAKLIESLINRDR